ncbi:hypothetical protein [Microbacterium album]|uniref:Uncharacterized protein n=1 Tax=Microbacterium album TaxID=2053191 RepID=A0A917IFN0_9MICO|nr:hypothetical protein [Microbacterium album]GGH44168.1 hypothetical protein GCM10010921_18630 [Microbacterium album]
MTTVIALVLLGLPTLVLVAATLRELARDGYRAVETDWQRLPDRD